MNKMENLPNEILTETLLSIPLADLRNTCQTNTLYYNICSEEYFWRERFHREGLEMIEKGETLTEWILILKNSLYTRDIIDTIDGDIYLTLDTVISPNILVLPGVSSRDIDSWIGISLEKVNRAKSPVNLLIQSNAYKISRDSEILQEGTLSPKERKRLLFPLVYFNVI